ncbi:MAG TPA: DUF3365 domain-containing protein [Enhygromyxa sp.]|nr:DUF3365 domain-containing protein [Enhygromyxa sp.]
MLTRRRSSKVALVLLASLSACKSSGPERDGGGAQEAGSSAAEQASGPISRARGMTKAFATELQSTLLAAIEAGGPAHAIDVCKQAAPKITAAQGSEGWTLSRTALRVRNPGNAPTSWQRDVLASWQAQLEAGEVQDVASLEWFDIHDGELRYMRAIPLGGVCVGCHGPVEQISAEVKAALAERYPDDQATGFEVGQLRGAFVVMGPVD